MASLRTILEGIEQRQELTPQAVVAYARPKNSPLHARFEWNNTVAAEKYREYQAWQLIRSVKVSFETSSGDNSKVRKYHPVRGEDAPASVYEPIEDIVTDPVKRQLLLRAMRRDWRAFQARYKALEEFTAFVQAELAEGFDQAS